MCLQGNRVGCALLSCLASFFPLLCILYFGCKGINYTCCNACRELHGVLRPPLRPKNSTGNLAAMRHPLGRNGFLIGLYAQSTGFCLPSRPALRSRLQRRALPSLWGALFIRGYPFAGLCLRRLTPIRCTSVLAHWVWTTHPAPASGFAYGCKRVAANSGAPGLHPPPRTATARAIATTGATVSNTLAVQSVDLLVVSGRLPPPPAAPAGAGLPEGYALDACTPTTAVGSPSTHRAKAVSSAPSAWRVQL